VKAPLAGSKVVPASEFSLMKPVDGYRVPIYLAFSLSAK